MRLKKRGARTGFKWKVEKYLAVQIWSLNSAKVISKYKHTIFNIIYLRPMVLNLQPVGS